MSDRGVRLADAFMRPGWRVLSGTLLTVAVLLAMFSLLRVALLLMNLDHLEGARAQEVAASFLMGLRFDLRIVVYAVLPLLLAVLFPSGALHRFSRAWLMLFASAYLFLGLLELPFYGEFQQRLNDLVLQYLREDTGTVLKMLWAGEPVLRYLLLWFAGTWLLWRLFVLIDRHFHPSGSIALRHRIALSASLFLAFVLCARGTLGSGPPLRWGDAYQSDHEFLNHLGLNGVFTLAKSQIYRVSKSDQELWSAALPGEEAVARTRAMLLQDSERLLDPAQAAVRRQYEPPATGDPHDYNVVIVLMESFSAQFVGALGDDRGVTPEFDRLTERGVLFTRFFSNGTHTHQGIFATLTCFPNLPGYEFLMQQPEGRNRFSGISEVLDDYHSLFVYNGDFSWDNQSGFFRNQGMKHMVGRYDFENPRFIDPVWGVSDEDMFERAVEELDGVAGEGPFVAVLQTLSNHLPYAIPEPLPFEPVRIEGEISERLTAMKYADWALGRFFDAMDERDYASNTLFLLLGDHGFGVPQQLTSVNLLRFHVPLLVIGPGLRERHGDRVARVASQVDVIPTIIGVLGRERRHQCWGRDQFHLPQDDPGVAVIKPSGGDPHVAIVKGSRILTLDRGGDPRMYSYSLVPPRADPAPFDQHGEEFELALRSYVQTAMASLIGNTTGIR